MMNLKLSKGVPKNLARIVTGTYVGDGNASQLVVLPFKPKRLEVEVDLTGVIPTVGETWFRKTDTMPAGGTRFLTSVGILPTALISAAGGYTFTSRGFVTAGAFEGTNIAGALYNFVAWG